MSSVLAHKGCRWIALGWTAFIAENLVLSEFKEDIVAHFGQDNYRLTYSTLSTAACGSIAYGFLAHGRQQGPVVTSLAKRFPLIVFSVQALGLAGMASLAVPKLQIPFTTTSDNDAPSSITTTEVATPTFTVQCPVDFKAGKTDLKEVTRYPMLFSFGLATLGTSLASPFLSLRLLAGFPIVMAVVGGLHQDRRHLRSGELDQATYDKTSLLPFVALAQHGGWEALAEKLPWVNIGVGVVFALGLARRRMVLLKPASSGIASKLPPPLA
ncbi:hypothetical protein DYB37_002020 [Aphanomyces astaci]|uniref:NnrU domain-containing protein n=1 Tax=Aphanomyces astaci TaxID=112090 RepID=A0A397EA99_APHAT|nr:hypothetical protein DYB31_002290 [Aphanomyces astaci]RHY81312.1 hypothetical protein DYB35_001261 [Aphanomyces astaci]RHZ23599.1 hypothetical protein DYB37_002020 [Aphanomyces astaci]